MSELKSLVVVSCRLDLRPTRNRGERSKVCNKIKETSDYVMKKQMLKKIIHNLNSL